MLRLLNLSFGEILVALAVVVCLRFLIEGTAYETKQSSLLHVFGIVRTQNTPVVDSLINEEPINRSLSAT